MIMLYLAFLENPEDETAFLEMYHKHLPMLTKAGLKFFADKWFVEDALQLTWMSVALNFNKISSLPRHETAPYLVTIMKNKCRDILRKENMYTELIAGEDVVLEDDIDDRLHIQHEYKKLVEAIRKLPDIYREVLERRLIIEESNGEVAKNMGISEMLAAKRYSRGRAILKENMIGEVTHLE